MASSYLHQFLVILFLFPFMRTTVGYNTNSSMKEKFQIKCLPREKQALLKLKGGLIDYHNLLSSWGSKEEDCCRWERVRCNRRSGHVDALDLRPSIKSEMMKIIVTSTSFSGVPSSKGFAAFGGEINSSLFDLQHLTYLDLSLFGGNFDTEPIGNSFKELRYLNLSWCYLGGTIPPQLGNLSKLVSLDLSHNNFHNVESIEWLSHLLSLQHLDLSYIKLSRSKDWLYVINSLPSLLSLNLNGCELTSLIPQPRFHVNSSKALSRVELSSNSLTSAIFPWLLNFNNSLVHLDLLNNKLKGEIPEALGGMVSLEYLNLAWNNLQGKIPRALGNLHRLQILYVTTNNLTGELPSVKNFSSLRELYVSFNKLNGSLPESLWTLSNLEVLDLASNLMSGVISETHFSNFTKLWTMEISHNSFILNLSSEWIPPFQLQRLGLNSCKLGPRFPQWLQTQKQILVLGLSNCGIADAISDWFWKLPSKLTYLDLSGNQIRGEVQNLSSILGDFSSVDLSSNRLYGSVPRLPPNVTTLNLSKNRFSGTLSNFCYITGQSLTYLDVSNNSLSGKLPDCWKHWPSLNILSLANNNFSGSLPVSFGSLGQIQTMHLRNNSFSGELPPSLVNCRQLGLLDVGENQLSGKIPEWVGRELRNLIVLRIRSNHFYGAIPSLLCHLTFVQILDLSHNNLTGRIPQCLGNFSVMARGGGAIETFNFHNVSQPIGFGMYLVVPYVDFVLIVWKGMELEYGKTLGLVKSLDLSSNSLSGDIPSEITSLLGLVALNLSHNELTGSIPPKIGQLKSLQSFDLSVNQLSGRLPEGLRDLNFLSHLNLSYNKLSGKIPVSTQLQSFDDTSFMGNTDLCGLPLPNLCSEVPAADPYPSTKQGSSEQNADDDDWLITQGFYVCLGLGFATGFWAVFGTLILHRSCRHAFCYFVNDIEDWLYVTIVLRIAKLLRRLQD